MPRIRPALTVFTILAAGCMLMEPLRAQTSDLQTFEPAAATGMSAAVQVPDRPLAHTGQLLPLNDNGQVTGESVQEQTAAVLQRLQTTLQRAGSHLELTVKLNLYVTDAAAQAAVHSVLAQRFSGAHKPAVSLVVTALPVPGALVAVDAVAAISAAKAPATSVQHMPGCAVLPAGSRIYVSGQAENHAALADATRETLNSLRATLRWLERTDGDIVQLKVFLMPMADSRIVQQEIARCFADSTVPPVVLVEWKSSATTPVEIELIAWGGHPRPAAPVLEYSTPPGMTTSPIYSRVCRINSGPTIYISGLYAAADPSTNAESAEAGEQEVRQVFETLQRLLAASGSDLQHLVKATYYVSTTAASQKLNELRPQYYDPQRPPAASKAVVTSVGRPGLGLTVDMLAVPRP